MTKAESAENRQGTDKVVTEEITITVKYVEPVRKEPRPTGRATAATDITNNEFTDGVRDFRKDTAAYEPLSKRR